VFFRRGAVALKRDLESFIMENILFKVQYPCEYHAQSAVEASCKIHPQIVHRTDEIHSIVIQTTRACLRTIDKTGQLRDSNDRDHCLQYCVAVGLLYGTVTAEHFQDSVAQDPRIDQLRKKMQVMENPQYSADYLDPDKRSISNAIQVHFTDRTSTKRIEIEYPQGHRRNRTDCYPALQKKFMGALSSRLPPSRAGKVFEMCMDAQLFDSMPVPEFLQMFAEPPVPFILPDVTPHQFPSRLRGNIQGSIDDGDSLYGDNASDAGTVYSGGGLEKSSGGSQLLARLSGVSER